jgi:glycine cleavage system H protein
MSEIPTGFLYTDDHEYLRPADEDGEFFVGITEYAQGELGDVVFLELPTVGDSFERGETFGTIEAVKAVSDLYSPVTGEVLAVNGALDDDPSLVNSEPYQGGWMVRMRSTTPSEVDALLSPEDYRAHIGPAG